MRSADSGRVRVMRGVLAAAFGDGVLPPDLLLDHVDLLQREILAPPWLDNAVLSPREIDVLRLAADGMDAVEIARELCYSEHTLTNIVSGRPLRNRSDAAA